MRPYESIRTGWLNHALQGDEQTRTAEWVLSTDPAVRNPDYGQPA